MSKLLNVSKRRSFKRRSARVQPTVEEKAERQERLDKLLSNNTPDYSPISEEDINKAKNKMSQVSKIVMIMKPISVDPKSSTVVFGFYLLDGSMKFTLPLDYKTPKIHPLSTQVWQAKYDYKLKIGDKNIDIIIHDPVDNEMYDLNLDGTTSVHVTDRIIRKIAVKFKKMTENAGSSKSKKVKKKKQRRSKTVKRPKTKRRRNRR